MWTCYILLDNSSHILFFNKPSVQEVASQSQKVLTTRRSLAKCAEPRVAPKSSCSVTWWTTRTGVTKCAKSAARCQSTWRNTTYHHQLRWAQAQVWVLRQRFLPEQGVEATHGQTAQLGAWIPAAIRACATWAWRWSGTAVSSRSTGRGASRLAWKSASM